LRRQLCSTELWKLYKVRNVIAHRRGLIDLEYKANTGDPSCIGERIKVSPDQLVEFLVLAGQVGIALLNCCNSHLPLRRPDDLYLDLARRLAASYESYRLRLAGVDYALKRYVPEEIGDYWVELARKIVDEFVEERGRILSPGTK
jgi:hypothetical protein